MPPQSQALESVPADKDGVSTKRGTEVETISAPGVQHGREETAVPTPKDVVTVAQQRNPNGNRSHRGNSVQPRVFVLDKRKKPLDPTSPARARELLKKGRARVHKMMPFTIRLIDRIVADSVVHDHTIGIDPGSRTTGIAVARETRTVDEATGEITTDRQAVSLVELVHRGPQIKKKLQQRAGYRRGRRSRNLRYRAPRFNNRTKPKGWLPPSLQHRVDSTMTWVNRFQHLAPVSKVAYEAVRFDTQKLQNPEITGVEYQLGTLAGFEVREYLLEKFNRTCVYCDATNVPLNIDHVHPRARGGSDRVSNLVTACILCNQAKGKLLVEEFVSDRKRLEHIRKQLKVCLRDAAIVTATRWSLHTALMTTGLYVVASSGGRTKFNRSRLGVPKEHCLDALCVGDVDSVGQWPDHRLTIATTGRGLHQRTQPNKYGFPRSYRTRRKVHYGFITGDFVHAIVPRGKNAGTHVGRAAVRKSGSFDITTTAGTRQGIRYKYVTLIQRGDGFNYSINKLLGRSEVARTNGSAYSSLRVESSTIWRT
ncbi:RNA-guided endonuclease IscB [Brevibacterium aurantiacum]|uniref:HNH endonuclease n=1 Tax=Brevibacterium aurantiacum TaxID=273384 RepID=A0A556C511_BREAU|nr:RNA-guided endonuclease IscB [Brevibacterium aurantiacum]TSI12470.1 HNH endonuclease [Brevibacterium aurantiacum]